MRFLPAFLLLSLLAACGQVGDLYLPEKESVETVPASPAPATNEPKKKK